MLSTTCAALLALAAPQDPAPAPAPDAQFAAPIRLTANGAPLADRIIYPSPRLLDIDLDGTLELVVGDLPGRVHVAERDGEGGFAWTALKNFATEGRPLKFHNW